MLSPEFADSCVLFGDSITQTSAVGTLYQRVAEYYERRLDVVNRGFSGYNAELGLPTLKRVLVGNAIGQKIRLLTIWLGANDAVLPPSSQHCPLDRYKRHLHEMISLLHSPGSASYDPKTRIILITPTPICSEYWCKQHVAWAIGEGRAQTAEEALRGTMRDSAVTKQYAEACIEVGRQASVEVLDAHSGMIRAAGGCKEELLMPFFTDGLHLTPRGYEVVFGLLVDIIEKSYPEIVPTSMLPSMPDYSLFDTAESSAQSLISATQAAYRHQWD